MHPPDNVNRLNRNYGLFFVFLAALSLGLAYFDFGLGHWEPAVLLLAGVLLFGVIGWWAIAGPILRNAPEEDDDDGMPGAINPSPIMPVPSHRLAAARELRPPERAHCLVMD